MPDEFVKSWRHLRDMLMHWKWKSRRWMNALIWTEIDLNRFLGCKNQILMHETFSKNDQHNDWPLTLIFQRHYHIYPFKNSQGILKLYYTDQKSPKNGLREVRKPFCTHTNNTCALQSQLSETNLKPCCLIAGGWLHKGLDVPAIALLTPSAASPELTIKSKSSDSCTRHVPSISIESFAGNVYALLFCACHLQCLYNTVPVTY